MTELEQMNAIADSLKKNAGLTNTYTEFMGGGIVCIVVPCGAYTLYFGTANETWGADVYKGDDFMEDLYIETNKLIDLTNVDLSAVHIMDAAMAFDGEHA